LLKGLEISVLNLSVLNKWNDRFRFDAEYVKKEYLLFEKKLEQSSFKRLVETDCKILHPSEIKREYVEKNGVWFFRTQNIRPLRIEHSNDVFISINDAQRLSKNKIKKGDVVITRTGANFGQTAIYNIDDIAIGSSHTFILRNTYFNQSYLAVFFNTIYGRKLIDKGMYGGSQPEIAPYYLSHIPIPDLTNSFQVEIENILINSINCKKKSDSLYKQAENLLLEEIGLQNFTPSKEPINIKSFKDSFGTSGRLDAEYYQLKYEQVVNKVKSKPFDILSNLVDIKKSIEPGSKNYVENGLPFMRVADLSKNGLSEPQKYISNYFVKENQDKISKLKPKKGTILFSKDGSVGIAYHLRQDYNGITSGAILHLNVKDESKIIPEYLTLALNSKVVQMQAERDAGGSIILHWRSSEIENVVIPIIDFKKQQQIAELIEQSFSLKKESEHLLEVAKRVVEIAIEETEEIALKYITKEIANA